MELKVEIRRNSDGAMATDTWSDWTWNEFWWSKGNASCDCNRMIFFSAARNEEEPDDDECSEGKYSVRLSDAQSGEVLYDEIDGVEL